MKPAAVTYVVESVSEVRRHFSSVRFTEHVDRRLLQYTDQLINHNNIHHHWQHFSPLQLPLQPLRGLLPILLLGEQRHDGCEQFT